MEAQKHPALISANLFLDITISEKGMYPFTVVTNISHAGHGKMMECAMLVRKAVDSAVKSLPSCYKVQFQKIIVRTSDNTYELTVGGDWKVENPHHTDSEKITYTCTFYCTSKDGVADAIAEVFAKHGLPIEIW